MNDIADLVGRLGFPVVVAAYVLIRLERVLWELVERVGRLEREIRRGRS